MIDLNELRRLGEGQQWIGRWYDAGCETLMAERDGEHEEVAHPIPIGLVPYLVAVQPAAISELLDRLEEAEKERDELLASIDEWLNKTKWVQQGVNEGTISAKYIGLHRADVMASLLGKAEKERDEFKRACFGHISDNSMLRAKVEQMEKRLQLILEEPENTMSNSKALREMVRQAQLALKESK